MYLALPSALAVHENSLSSRTHLWANTGQTHVPRPTRVLIFVLRILSEQDLVFKVSRISAEELAPKAQEDD